MEIFNVRKMPPGKSTAAVLAARRAWIAAASTIGGTPSYVGLLTCLLF
jgi:hypothetical protein